MRIPLYQVDAFASAPFEGNPAAVCPLESWPDDGLLQSIAAENNLSETAFFAPEGGALRLRWFTPTAEVDLCGHATLASAWVLFHRLGHAAKRIDFDTRSGRLTATRREEGPGGTIVLDFPARAPRACEPARGLVEALGAEPEAVLLGEYPMVVYGDEASVRELRPDFGRLAAVEPTVIVTAPSDRFDFVSRFFAPGFGIDEDPVTGSAHCTLAPYWGERLGRGSLVGRQISRRGGTVECELAGDRVRLGGTAVGVVEGTIHLD